MSHCGLDSDPAYKRAGPSPGNPASCTVLCGPTMDGHTPAWRSLENPSPVTQAAGNCGTFDISRSVAKCTGLGRSQLVEKVELNFAGRRPGPLVCRVAVQATVPH